MGGGGGGGGGPVKRPHNYKVSNTKLDKLNDWVHSYRSYSTEKQSEIQTAVKIWSYREVGFPFYSVIHLYFLKVGVMKDITYITNRVNIDSRKFRKYRRQSYA